MTVYITAISPDGEMDYLVGDSWEDAYEQAKAEFGNGVTIRESWYKEWVCGSKETGPCWFDKYGKHHVTDGITCDECGNSYKPENIVNHGNGEKFCLECQ